MLTYLPGEVIGDRVPWPAWAYADSTLVQVGQWMRRIHDATADFMPPEDARWFIDRAMQHGWIVGHQDAAPYNAVMKARRSCGCRSPLRRSASSQARAISGTGPAAFICCSMADAGDRASIALLPIASRLEQSASYVEALPADFWTP
jgi:hypothetical protein